MKINPLDRISDFEIQETFENRLREVSSESGVGYFTAEVERDEKGLKIVLRVAAMVDTAGTEDFTKKKELNTVTVDFPEGPVVYKVEEAVTVTGMEMEVVYRPKI